MAVDCATLNEREEGRFYCLSADSDFLLMKNCPTIRFDDLDSLETTLFPTYVKIPVWRRNKVANMYGLTEEQLVHCCILAGNDFTSAFKRVGDRLSELLGQGMHGCVRMLNVRDIHNRSHRMAVEYSLAFYETGDLTPYLLDEFKTSDQLESHVDYQEGIRLSKTVKDKLCTWLASASQGISGEFEMGNMAIRFMNLLQESQSLSLKFSSPESIQCLRTMLLQLSGGRPAGGEFGAIKLSYDAQRLANIYQLLVKEIARSMNRDEGQLAMFDPSSVYDGKTFHRIFYDTILSPVISSRASEVESRAATFAEAVRLATASTSATQNEVQRTHRRSLRLPSDRYRQEILDLIAQDQVSIIQGETGCGKSSRVPVFILEDSEANRRRCKIMVTQPRRIAVINLKKRLQEQLGNKVGMRLGYGVREETQDTKIFFVTTGYLVQLMAHYPEALNDVTHIIIDEVHERSLDTDLLCWQTREHIRNRPNCKLVLMSATLDSSLYSSYFEDRSIYGSPLSPALSVGERRFPVEILHIKDIVESNWPRGRAPASFAAICSSIASVCTSTLTSRTVSSDLAKLQYKAAVMLVRAKGRVGTSVVIFVSGISDIVELEAAFDGKDKYQVVAIHSAIQYDEQDIALLPPPANKVKVIIATNAAESSVTFPNLDIVICLGTHKAMNSSNGDAIRSTLTNSWISKSSATQRAGRTGRVRPGTVYRMYTQEMFDTFDDFEEAEIFRKPLHEAVLSLKATFEDAPGHMGVIPIFNELLDAPNESDVQNGIDYLFRQQLLSTATDHTAKLTVRGRFAGQISLDVTLANMVLYGIALGVGIEALVAAVAMAQPRSPLRVAHPLLHKDPRLLNAIVRQTFLTMAHFDDSTYSEAIMMLRLFAMWNSSSEQKQKCLCQDLGIAAIRMKQFVNLTQQVLKQVNDLLASISSDPMSGRTLNNSPPLDIRDLRADLTVSQINRLRLCILWAQHDNLMWSKGEDQEYVKSLRFNRDEDPSFTPEVMMDAFPEKQVQSKLIAVGKYMYTIPSVWTCEEDDKTRALRRLVKLMKKSGEDMSHVRCSTATFGTAATTTAAATDTLSSPCEPSATFHMTLVFQNKRGLETLIGELATATIPVPPVECTTEVAADLRLGDDSTFKAYVFRSMSYNTFCVAERFLTSLSGVGLRLVSQALNAKLSVVNQPNPSEIPMKIYERDMLKENSELREQLRAGVPVQVTGLGHRIHFSQCDLVPTTQPSARSGDSIRRYQIPARRRIQEEQRDESLVAMKRTKRLWQPFEDLPIGVRLFNAYCVVNRDNEMRYRQIEPDEPDPVSEEGDKFRKERDEKRLRRSELIRRLEMDESADVDFDALDHDNRYEIVHVLNQKAKVPAWKVLRGDGWAWRDPIARGDDAGGENDEVEDGYDDDDDADAGNDKLVGDVTATSRQRGNKRPMSLLDEFSFSGHGYPALLKFTSPVATSSNKRAQTLYAVAFRTLEIRDRSSRKANVVCNDITVFPEGESWVRRGLLCVGKYLESDSDQRVDALPDGAVRPSTDTSTSEICKLVRLRLLERINGGIAYDEALEKAVEFLFADQVFAEEPTSEAIRARAGRSLRAMSAILREESE